MANTKKSRSIKTQRKEIKTLDEALETIVVLDEWENQVSDLLEGWFAVSNDDGIIAYFGKEVDAFAFRLHYINRILNP